MFECYCLDAEVGAGPGYNLDGTFGLTDTEGLSLEPEFNLALKSKPNWLTFIDVFLTLREKKMND